MNSIHSIGRSCVLVIVAFVSAFLILGCSEEQSGERRTSEGRIVHPIDNKVPHSETDPVVVNKENTCTDAPDGENVKRIRQYVEGERTTEKLNIDVSGHKFVEVRSLDTNTLLVLDRRENVLWRYDIPLDRAVKVAGSGSGPGELNFAGDLTVRGEYAYVAQSDMHIDAFSCGPDSCAYTNTIQTGFQLRTVANRGEKGFVAMGLIPMSKDRQRLETLEGALQLLNANGDIVTSFGETYDTEAWLLKDYYKRGGNLHYDEGRDMYVRSAQSLPRIYLYDSRGSLQKVYKIKQYIQPVIDYDPEKRKRGTPDQEDFSELVESRFLEDGSILATVKTYVRSSPKTTEHKTHYKFDYYVIRPERGCSSFIGSDENVTYDGGEIVGTDHHTLKIEEGHLYKIN